MTDGKIYMGANGELMKAFDVKDGSGILEIINPRGIISVIITGRKSEIVSERSKELQIKYIYQNVHDKMKQLTEFLDEQGGSMAEVAYMGDDLSDISCIKQINEHGGFTGCPNDAINEIRKIAQFVSTKDGGHGAVREFIEWLCY